MGFANLTANVEAINKYKGNLDLALNYMLLNQKMETQ